jgi:uncharacterized protein YegL
MKQNYTKLVFIVDRSGSMAYIASDMSGGLKSLLEKEKSNNAGECDVSIYEFDDKYDIVYKNKNIKDVLPNYVLSPRGGTALYDAVGKTINSVGKDLSDLNEQDRPDRVLFVIITDGHENASKEFTQQQIKNMIEHQENVYKWTFSYLGANQDAFSVGAGFGIVDNSKILNYKATSAGVSSSFDALYANVSAFRKSRSVDDAKLAYSFKDSDQQIS